jgi:peptidylprolyl isomerase/FKBP-type peptidyl-prolyl cis-trans isomerase FklB
VPPALGYGDKGSGPIPPNSLLIFRIQLLGVLPHPGGTQLG